MVQRILEGDGRLLACLSVFLASATLLAGCEHRTTLLQSSPDDTAGSSGDGTLARADLTITAVVSAEDASIADALGLSDQRVSNGELVLSRSFVDDSTWTGVTDSKGEAIFTGLLEGTYTASILRLLTPEEIGMLSPADRDVIGFGGVRLVSVSAPRTELELPAVAGRRGSLLISEVSITIAQLSGGNWYRLANYMEVYNNTDSTIYLDGKVISKAIIFGTMDRNETFNCETMAPWHNDSEGIWTNRIIEAFPGSGQDHPLEPGEAAVIATDAIDHSEFHSDLPDLAQADFEFTGSSDVDNPNVPNMISLGKVWGDDLVGHGLFWGLTEDIIFLAEPVDVARLPRDQVPGALDPEYWRVPGEKILDVVLLGPTQEVHQRMLEAGLGGPLCERWVHETFNRGPARLVDSQKLRATHRRIFAALPDAAPVLQATETSARDLFAGSYSPGFIRIP